MNSFIPIHLHKNYRRIEQKLKDLCLPQITNKQIFKILNEFQELTSTHNMRPLQDYNVLEQKYSQQIKKIFKGIASFILSIDNKQIKIDLILINSQSRIILKKYQIIYLMCLMSLNLVPLQIYSRNNLKFQPSKNFNYIFNRQKYKTTTIIQYLKDALFLDSNQQTFNDEFIIKRNTIFGTVQQIIQSQKLFMLPFQVLDNNDSIQNYYGKIKVDFANKYIGGGALSRGSVQEEIMFANHPQLYTVILLIECLQDNQAIYLGGFKKYFKNSGYSYECKYAGKQFVKYQKIDKMSKQHIVAIDAVQFRNQLHQFRKQYIDREIIKSYAGFSIPINQQIVTGNWGCGAFNGNLKLKFIIQWISASLSKKKMKYCPFGKKQLLMKNQQLFQQLCKKQIKQVYKLLIQAAQQIRHPSDDLFEIMYKMTKKTSLFTFFDKKKQSDKNKRIQEQKQQRKQEYQKMQIQYPENSQQKNKKLTG